MLDLRDEELLLTLEQQVNPRHAALLVVDMQNDFCASGCFMDRLGGDVRGAQQMAPTLRGFMGEARKAGVVVVHIRANYDLVHMSGPMHERLRRHNLEPYCTRGSYGFEFYEGFEPREGELVVTKHRFDAFFDTELHMILQAHKIQSVLTTGVATHACVDSTARHAYFLGYYVVFVLDCVAGASSVQHAATLETMEQGFGVCASSEEIIRCWGKKRE